MKPLIVTFGLAIAAAAFGQQGQTPTGTTGQRHPATASANLSDTQGRRIGEAYLQQAPHGVLLKLNLKNATPGVHGLHIHDVGRCDRPTFESAGSHFNPSAREHGFLNPRGPHAGDLPNLEVPTTTQLSVEYFIEGVTLGADATSLLDANRSAIVIHSGKDDYATDPAGHSGDRLACGEISQSDTTR